MSGKPRPLLRLALFLVCAILIFLAFGTLFSFTNTLTRLDAIEAERDRWQRPADVLRTMAPQEGNTVVDLGAGSGYFALKLSPIVGKQGQVIAVDLRKLSLFFLWTRAHLRGYRNLQVVVGAEDDPHLPTGSVDSVLICNTYHEFRNPELILDQVFRSLRPGGHLVIVDRAPGAEAERGHEVALPDVANALQQKGFRIVSQGDRFIDRPGDDPWWILAAQKP